MNHKNIGLPTPPEFSEELKAECRASGDFRPMLFEWYKYVATLANIFAHIQPDSPGLKRLKPIHYPVCVGLLNRCARLMVSNLALSHEGKFGEATAILDRALSESSVILSWLCHKGDDESFERYLADGLKTELELKAEIEKAIQERGGKVLVIEGRMLASIQRYIDSSGLTEDQIKASKKLPDRATMIDAIGLPRLQYTVGQRIGSHHVHGTWPSLKMHYLEVTPEGLWLPNTDRCSTHQNQFLQICIATLSALRAFVQFSISDAQDIADMVDLFDDVEKEILEIALEADGNDYDEVPQP